MEKLFLMNGAKKSPTNFFQMPRKVLEKTGFETETIFIKGNPQKLNKL